MCLIFFPPRPEPASASSFPAGYRDRVDGYRDGYDLGYQIGQRCRGLPYEEQQRITQQMLQGQASGTEEYLEGFENGWPMGYMDGENGSPYECLSP
jgi:hypothetical protein